MIARLEHLGLVTLCFAAAIFVAPAGPPTTAAAVGTALAESAATVPGETAGLCSVGDIFMADEI